jgi:hypothetical protein
MTLMMRIIADKTQTPLYPFARLSPPHRGGGRYEVKAGKQASHISHALITKLDLVITFQSQKQIKPS